MQDFPQKVTTLSMSYYGGLRNQVHKSSNNRTAGKGNFRDDKTRQNESTDDARMAFKEYLC